MHKILGANGVIARELSRALAAGGIPVRQVSRHPRPVSATDEAVAADLRDAATLAAGGAPVA
jgi:uncharacterized protein YbjT (DUF2867 family)